MYVAPNHRDRPNDLIRLTRVFFNGHVVGQFCDAFFGEEACQQNVRIRQVELTYPNIRKPGLNLKTAPLLVIEQRGKNRRGIEIWITKEVDRAVHAYQRDRLHVADDAVIFNRLKTHTRVSFLLAQQSDAELAAAGYKKRSSLLFCARGDDLTQQVFTVCSFEMRILFSFVIVDRISFEEVMIFDKQFDRIRVVFGRGERVSQYLL